MPKITFKEYKSRRVFKVSQMSFEGNKNKLGRVLTEWHDGFTNAKKYFNTKFFGNETTFAHLQT